MKISISYATSIIPSLRRGFLKEKTLYFVVNVYTNSMSPPLSDSELVSATLKNPNEYAVIVERYETPLMRYIRRMV